MRLDDAKSLFVEMVRDLYSAETQLTLALPRVAIRAQSPTLRTGLENHMRETEAQVARLEAIAQELDFSPGGRVCIGMAGLLKEGEDAMGYGGDPSLVDEAIICACRKVEHYEIAAYHGLLGVAEMMGDMPNVRQAITATLREEEGADEALRAAALRAGARPAPASVTPDVA